MAERTAMAAPGRQNEQLLISGGHYRRMLVTAVVFASAVTLLPLAIMSWISYREYREAFRIELTRPMLRFAEAGQHSLDSYLAGRLSGLAQVIRGNSYDRLVDSGRLDSILAELKRDYGGVVDLGVIRDDGIQVAYAGPYGLAGRDYSRQPWFREVAARGSYVSDVFMGYRNLPHIVLAIQGQRGSGQSFVLRGTIDTDVFHWLVRDRESRRPERGSVCSRCHSLAVPSFSDAFILNDAGVLQTPSRRYGQVLDTAALPPLPAAPEPRFISLTDGRGEAVVAAFAAIPRSRFTLVLLTPLDAFHAGWRSLRRDLLLIPLVSGLVILGLIVGGATYGVRLARESDRKRAVLYHEMEYTNKLAAIGRLGAGVAHEINNPLAIITQKAGLLHDLLTMGGEPPPREKMVELVESVLRSAERCGGITHRLLGFAKHMDVQREAIDLDALLREVLEFLEKEASYRSIQVTLRAEEGTPVIHSDRGQLQQVFLNIINNAFAAVDEGGRIDIDIRPEGKGSVSVTVTDHGVGIPAANLEHIFDPFFTTKKGAGTGLGLSITYGIVQKLGGEIRVASEVGKGTSFTVVLPVEAPGG